MLEAMWAAIPVLAFGLVVAFAAWTWWKRKQEEPYDLRRLRDAHYEAPLAMDEEPEEDLVTDESGPYCYSCDEAYPAGTALCRHCGRPLG